MPDKHFVGLAITGFKNNGKKRPISRVTLMVDNDNAVTAGDDTGIELSANCPHATQAMVDAILAQVKGYQYQMYSADDANLDPAAELGDGVTVNGIYSVISRIDDDGSGYASISAPGEEEQKDEYPAAGPMTQQFDRQIAETRSQITKTAEQIRLEVANEVAGLSASVDVQLGSISAEIVGTQNAVSTLELSLDSITERIQDAEGNIGQLELTTSSLETRIEDAEGNYASLEQTVNSFELGVTNGDSSSKLSLYADGVRISSATISFTGVVTFDDLATEGTTTIHGGNIDTDTLKVNNLYGQYVYLNNSSGDAMGQISISGAATASAAVSIESYGALSLTAGYGDVYIESGNAAYLQLASDGVVVGGDDLISNKSGVYSCGTASHLWSNVFASTGVVQTSDRNKKHDIEELPGKYLKMLLELPVYRFKMDQGTSDRYHVGYVAQDVEAYMSKHEIDSLEFAGFVKGKDDDGNDIYMLRYEEFIAIHTLAIQKIYQKLEMTVE